MNETLNSFKILFKQILKYYLKLIVKVVLYLHKPLIIGVTGSANVFFTQDEIKRRLTEDGYEVRSNPKNFNTEIGLPLAILNLPAGYNSYKKWLPIMARAFKSIFKTNLPKILVLGLGISEPGDMKYLLSLVKPDIGIITDISQRYIESFDDMDELAAEYKLFSDSIRKSGILILNHDNERVRKISRNKKAVIYFSVDNKETITDDYCWRLKEAKKTIMGSLVTINNGKQIFTKEIKRFGDHHIRAFISGLIVKDVIKSYDMVK